MFYNPQNKKLRILLDSDSLKSDSAKRLLHYNDNELFEFVSLGESRKHTVAKLNFGGENDTSSIIVDKSIDCQGKYKSKILFNYNTSDIEAISISIDIKYSDLILVFILATFIKTAETEKTILVTERKKLLNRTNWGKDGFPSLPAQSILSPDETLIFIDLHCKRQKKFLVAPDFYVNRGLWYLYSLKSKLTEYQAVWSVIVFDNGMISERDNLMNITASLADRITDMLIAIDEIGINYYTEVNNDTQDTIIYHFNYWITLFTGIFDSLAWISKYRYQIEFDKVERIGLRTNRQKYFTELLFEKNAKLKDFLSKNSSVINLMYDPRDLVIHRERLKGLRVDDRNKNLYFNMLRIPKAFFKQIVELSKEKGDVFGKWGHYNSYDEFFLEPYSFVKKATSALIEFVNEYLKLLDFCEYEKNNKDRHDSKEHNDFLENLDRFIKFKLGY